MAFTFIHTADWQLGKRFGGFPLETRALLGDARFAAIDTIAAIAGRAGAAHVLVAGDVFDDSRASMQTLRQAMARLSKHQRITWHLLPGNHDADRESGAFQRAAVDGLPGNVRLHVEPQPVEIEPGVVLLPAPLKARALASDPAAWMSDAATPPGALRIGLAHGSIRKFGSGEDAAVPIDPARAKASGLDYLALGDWHGTLKIDDRTWYSGTPEPDRFVDNDSGNVLVVTCSGKGALPNVERMPSGHFQMIEATLDAGHRGAFDAWVGELKSGEVPSERLLVRLTLCGRIGLTERAAIGGQLERLSAELRDLHVDLDGLLLRVEGDDLASLSGEAGFGDLAVRLAAEAADDEPAKAAVARRALELLLDLSRAAETPL